MRVTPIALTPLVASPVSVRPVFGVSMELCASTSTNVYQVTDAQQDLNVLILLDLTRVNVPLATNRLYEILALYALT